MVTKLATPLLESASAFLIRTLRTAYCHCSRRSAANGCGSHKHRTTLCIRHNGEGAVNSVVVVLVPISPRKAKTCRYILKSIAPRRRRLMHEVDFVTSNLLSSTTRVNTHVTFVVQPAQRYRNHAVTITVKWMVRPKNPSLYRPKAISTGRLCLRHALPKFICRC